MREEENKRTSRDSKVKTFMKKRWAFPAIYIASAAIILTGVLWYQNSATDKNEFDMNADAPNKEFTEPAVPVNEDLNNFAMPVIKPNSVVIEKEFYDNAESKEKQVDALVFYNNSYSPNTGIDIKMKDDSEFDVVASLAGTVTKVEEDAVLGNTIEIKHDSGIVTFYQSVKDFKVEVGQEVQKGDTLAKAGKSQYNAEAGVHVHFEIRKDNVAVNPIDYIDRPLSALQKEDITGNSQATSTEETTTNDTNTEKEDATTESDDASTDTTTNNEETNTNSDSTEEPSA